MNGIIKIALLLFLALILAGFVACEKAVESRDDGSSYDNFVLSVTPVTLDTVTVGNQKLYKQQAYRLRITDNSGRNPASATPMIFNLYKVFPTASSGDTLNLIGRLFAGGKGYQAGDRVYYTDSRGIMDTLLYRVPFETLMVFGADNMNKFHFAAAALTGLIDNGSSCFVKGFENRVLADSREFGGGMLSYLQINGQDVSTPTPFVNVAARFNLSNVDTLFYYRFSSMVTIDFTQLQLMETLLKSARAVAKDSQYLPVPPLYRLRITDSALVDSTGSEVGRYGGCIRIDSSKIATFFNTVTQLPPPRPDDVGWVALTRKDTLLMGSGTKYIYLHARNWKLPMSDQISIRPWTMNISMSGVASGNTVTCLTDQIPFSIHTFGDTTFDSQIYVWIATCNIFPRLLSEGKIANAVIKDNITTQTGAEWPDAILETPPELKILSSKGAVSGTLNPDYEKNYRVSPLTHQFIQKDRTSTGSEYNGVDGVQSINRLPNLYLSQQMKRGSILGYEEKNLGNFNSQDSIVSRNLTRIPFTGWFTVEDLGKLSPSRSINPDELVSYFAPRYGVSTLSDLYPVKDANTGIQQNGHKFYSIYSAYFWVPDPSKRSLYNQTSGGLRLYKNPMRSVPYYVSKNTYGNKEFVICVYGRGKYFKEPRAYISSFGRESDRVYVWDKIPPHVLWDTTSNPYAARYAPTYYPTGKQTDLSKTTIPFVFDVWMAGQNSIIDNGGAKITSVKLCFNYSSDLDTTKGFRGIDPITGSRYYTQSSLKFDIDSRYLGGSAIQNAVFRNIDARLWQSGLWDMWLETEDERQNRGVAPLNSSSGYDVASGLSSVRQIKK